MGSKSSYSCGLDFGIFYGVGIFYFKNLVISLVIVISFFHLEHLQTTFPLTDQSVEMCPTFGAVA